MYQPIHTSDRAAFKRCRQYWEFTSPLRRNLEPKLPVTPLWFGTGVHAALAAYYDPQKAVRDPEEGLVTFRTYVNTWLSSLESPTVEQEEWARDLLQLGEGILSYYFMWAQTHDAFDVIAVEYPFQVPVPGMPGTTYHGTVDGIVRDFHGKYWILEHKTTAQFTESLEWLSFDDQCGSYIWALSKVVEFDIEGVVYNEIRKKAPQPLRRLKDGSFSTNKNQDTTFEIALRTLREEYGKIPRRYHEFLDYLRYKPDKFVRRTYVRRSRDEIRLLGEALKYEVLDMLNTPFIYRTPSRINCQSCPFTAPCSLKWEGRDFEWLLMQEFREKAPRE